MSLPLSSAPCLWPPALSTACPAQHPNEPLSSNPMLTIHCVDLWIQPLPKPCKLRLTNILACSPSPTVPPFYTWLFFFLITSTALFFFLLVNYSWNFLQWFKWRTSHRPRCLNTWSPSGALFGKVEEVGLAGGSLSPYTILYVLSVWCLWFTMRALSFPLLPLCLCFIMIESTPLEQ